MIWAKETTERNTACSTLNNFLYSRLQILNQLSSARMCLQPSQWKSHNYILFTYMDADETEGGDRIRRAQNETILDVKFLS
jgi:hypothetical protein